MKASLRKALLFTLILLPVAAAGAYFCALYQMDILGEELMAEVLAQLGSAEAFVAVYIVQIIVYMLFMGFGGYLLAEKVGLMKPLRPEKAALAKTLPLCVLAGALFSLDYWTFGAWVPDIREATDTTLNFRVFMASVVYGGVVEEVMMRLFMMSLLSFLGWKIFFRKQEKAPAGVIIAANVLSAALFAAGHLPATVLLFGQVTPPAFVPVLPAQRRFWPVLWLAVPQVWLPVCHSWAYAGAYREQTGMVCVCVKLQTKTPSAYCRGSFGLWQASQLLHLL